MTHNPNRKSGRRDFLVTSAIPMLSPLVLKQVLASDHSSSQEQPAPATETISVGYWLPSSDQAQVGRITTTVGTDRARPIEINQKLPSMVQTIADPHKIDPREAARAGAKFKPDVVRAQDIEPEFLLHDRKARISILGVYTSEPHWKDDDTGTFLMKVEFKPIEVSCQKISNVTIGSSFKARKNDFIPNLSSGLTIKDDIPVAYQEGLKFSFDLVDVKDARDRKLVGKVFDVASKLPLVKEGLAAVGAAPYITAASTILELFGRNYLTTSPANTTLWSKSVAIELTPSETRLLPKLRSGVYFFGGYSKHAGGSPAWGEYQLRGTGLGSTGDLKYLYQQDQRSGMLVAADFSYVMIEIRYAS